MEERLNIIRAAGFGLALDEAIDVLLLEAQAQFSRTVPATVEGCEWKPREWELIGGGGEVAEGEGWRIDVERHTSKLYRGVFGLVSPDGETVVRESVGLFRDPAAAKAAALTALRRHLDLPLGAPQ